METKVIEEIPEPQHVIATEYNIAHYTCPHCQKEVVATDSSCPKEGIFGNNTIAQAALLKYEDRLPHRKIRNAAVAAESTNNRAEKAQIAEHVIQRKIVGTLRNRKGTSIHERIMTVLATWARAGDSTVSR